MLRYRKLHNALRSALRGDPVDLDTLRPDDRVLIETVRAQRGALEILGAKADCAEQNYAAQSYVVEVLGERMHSAMLGEKAATA